jgi:hypothetical protein
MSLMAVSMLALFMVKTMTGPLTKVIVNSVLNVIKLNNYEKFFIKSIIFTGLLKYKPKNNYGGYFGYWFNDNKRGMTKRIKILKTIINEMDFQLKDKAVCNDTTN